MKTQLLLASLLALVACSYGDHKPKKFDPRSLLQAQEMELKNAGLKQGFECFLVMEKSKNDSKIFFTKEDSKVVFYRISAENSIIANAKMGHFILDEVELSLVDGEYQDVKTELKPWDLKKYSATIDEGTSVKDEAVFAYDAAVNEFKIGRIQSTQVYPSRKWSKRTSDYAVINGCEGKDLSLDPAATK